jgi:hypothetical protein
MLEKYPTADIGLQLASVSTANVTANDLWIRRLTLLQQAENSYWFHTWIMIMTINIFIVIILSTSRRNFKQQYYKLCKKLKDVSSTSSKISLICIKKMVHTFQLNFSNIFTHHPVEIYVFLLLHLTSLITTSTKFTFIIIDIIFWPCVFVTIYFNVYLSILLSYRCIWN